MRWLGAFFKALNRQGISDSWCLKKFDSPPLCVIKIADSTYTLGEAFTVLSGLHSDNVSTYTQLRFRFGVALSNTIQPQHL